MRVLYSLYGEQHMVEVSETGHFSPLCTILHDERKQGPMPQSLLDGYAALERARKEEKEAAEKAKRDQIGLLKGKIRDKSAKLEDVLEFLTLVHG